MVIQNECIVWPLSSDLLLAFPASDQVSFKFTQPLHKLNNWVLAGAHKFLQLMQVVFKWKCSALSRPPKSATVCPK